MKSTSYRSYLATGVGGLVIVLLVALVAYIAGYVLLPNKFGLYQSEWQLELFKPAMYVQRWVTGKSVISGYPGTGRMGDTIFFLPYPPSPGPILGPEGGTLPLDSAATPGGRAFPTKQFAP